MYSTVQTGPKIYAGGLKDGLTRVGYQVETPRAVANPERPPITTGAATAMMSLAALFIMDSRTMIAASQFASI